MRCTRLIIFLALSLALILGIGAAPRLAGAGACKDLGLGKKCVVPRDVKKNAVNSRQVKNGSLTGADVKDGSLTGAEIQDAALTGADVEVGAIGKADLTSGIVAAGDILARTLLVSPVGDGADAAANGGELLAAITTLNGASPPPSATNPWVIKLEPGIYDVGATSAVLPPFVELEGSGQGVTQITGNVEGNTFSILGVVTLVSNTKLRQVTVSNAGGVTQPFAIRVAGGPTGISDVTATATGGTGLTLGILGDACGELTLTNVTATAGGSGSNIEGVRADCTSIVATNLTATGSDRGLAINGGTTSLRDSILTGSTRSVDVGTATVHIANSQLIGPTLGSPTCIGTYDASLAAVAC